MRRYLLSAICGLMVLSFTQPSRAQAPVAGQPYQVPDGYAGYGAGTSIVYGGYSYVIQADGTMLLADQSADSGAGGRRHGSDQAYQIPDGYAGYAAGTTIAYGGATYVIQANGTMMPASQSDASAGFDQGSAPTYLVPSGYDGYPAGSTITYGGSNYTIGLNGTMVLVTNTTVASNKGGAGAGMSYQSNYGKIPGTSPHSTYLNNTTTNPHPTNPHPMVGAQPLHRPGFTPMPHQQIATHQPRSPGFVPNNFRPWAAAGSRSSGASPRMAPAPEVVPGP